MIDMMGRRGVGVDVVLINPQYHRMATSAANSWQDQPAARSNGRAGAVSKSHSGQSHSHRQQLTPTFLSAPKQPRSVFLPAAARLPV